MKDENQNADELTALVLQIEKLENKIDSLKHQLTRKDSALRKKNLALDALHYVWCSGGCKGGTHRWDDGKITEEVVAEAERNTERLRKWFDNYKFRYHINNPLQKGP